MKKKNRFLVLFVGLVGISFFPMTASAIDQHRNDGVITCDKIDIQLGETTKCSLSLDGKHQLYGEHKSFFSARIPGFEISNTKYMGNYWKGSALGGDVKIGFHISNSIVFDTKDNNELEPNILTFDLTAKTNVSICPMFEYFYTVDAFEIAPSQPPLIKPPLIQPMSLLEDYPDYFDINDLKVHDDGFYDQNVKSLDMFVFGGACGQKPSANTTLVCDKTSAKKGDVVTCNVFVSDFEDATYLSMELNLPASLEFNDITFNTKWLGDYNNNVVTLDASSSDSGFNEIKSGEPLYTFSATLLSDYDVVDIVASNPSVTNSNGFVVDMLDANHSISIGSAISNPNTGSFFKYSFLILGIGGSAILLVYRRKKRIFNI